jgi:hypothetical protein
MGPIVALLPHPIPEENDTDETLDGQEMKIARTRILEGSTLRIRPRSKQSSIFFNGLTNQRY